MCGQQHVTCVCVCVCVWQCCWRLKSAACGVCVAALLKIEVSSMWRVWQHCWRWSQHHGVCVWVAVLLQIEVSSMWCVCGSVVEDWSQQHVACVWQCCWRLKSISCGVCVCGSVTWRKCRWTSGTTCQRWGTPGTGSSESVALRSKL